MTMRKPTMAQEIADLKVIIENRKARVQWLTSQIPTASKADLKWIAKELKEHEDWLKRTERQIKAFYAPASKEVSA